MPKHAKLSIIEFTRLISLDCFINSKILVVSGKDFDGFTTGMII